MLEQDIKFLAEELEKGKLIIFVGAGVSKNSGLPSWDELIKNYAEYSGIEKFTSKDFLTIPQEVFDRFGSSKYYEIVEKQFSGKYYPNSIHKILKKLDLTYIITTNYDTLIEDEIKYLQVVSKDVDLPYTKSNKMVIKMHGDLKNKNIVLKKSDYDNYENNFPLISTFIKGLFTTNTILFIGYSYNDVNVKQIMNWVKEILKENLRKAFIVDFTTEDEKEEENSEQINRIFLKVLEDKNYEKPLTKFLLDIYNNKNEIIKKNNIEIYNNLDYLMDYHLKEKYKNSEVVLNLKKFEEIEKKFFETFYNYNYQEFKNLKKIYSEGIKINKHIIVYGYLFFEEIEKAKKLIEKMIEEKENTNEKKEKIIWDNFLLTIIEEIKIDYNITENRGIESREILKEKYYEYFEVENELYNEIFRYKTFENISRDVNKLFDEVRKGKRTSYSGKTPLEKVIYLAKEFFYFCVLNGIWEKSFSEYHNFLKKYTEILFISYTNENKDDNKERCILGNRNILEKFDYFNFFMMLELSYSDSKKLFYEYGIKNLICENDVVEKLLVLLKNMLNWIEKYDEENKERNFDSKRNQYNKLQNLLLIISKLDLNEVQLKKLIDIILEFKNNRIFFEYNSIFEIVDIFRLILFKNFENLNQEFLEKILNGILKLENVDENLLNDITYYFRKKNIPKISKNNKMEKFINKNSLKIRCYFLRIIDEVYFEELKNEILKEIEEKLNIEVYSFLLNEKIINFDLEMEEKILGKLDEIFQEKNIDSHNLVEYISEEKNILDFLLVSSLNDRLPSSFIGEMRNYQNEEFFKKLEQYKLEVLWEYVLNKENFDYSKFSENELIKFTKTGIKNLLNKNNDKIVEIIKKYVFSKIKNDNNITEAYIEWENEKDETTK